MPCNATPGRQPAGAHPTRWTADNGMMVSARKRPLDAPLATGRPTPPAAGRDPLDDNGLEVVLTLTDLLRDVNGEVVLFNDSGMRTVGLLTSASVLEEGIAGRHVTADGVDVSEFRFFLF